MKKKLGKMTWNGEANPRWASKKGPLTGGTKAVGIKLAAFFVFGSILHSADME